MNILVTGANGQLGRTVAVYAAGSIHNYIYTDMFGDDARGVIKLDVTDALAVNEFVKSRQIDVIVNCAAYTAVDKAEDEPETADLVNHVAVAGMAKAAKENDAVLIHISTDYVFDGTSGVPYREEFPVNPQTVYGRTKVASEEDIVASGCRYIIFRTSWLYSVEGNNFVKSMINLTAEKPVLKVVFDQVGTPTFADDLADLICHIIEEDKLDRTGLYHYSNEGVCSWYDFAREICAQAGHLCDIFPCRTEEFPRKAPRPHYSVMDKTKVKETFDVEIPHWKDSLTICMSMLNEMENE